MAENLTVARPYAQATFEIALEENNLSGWQTMLEAMAVACKDQYFMDSLKLAPNSSVAADSLVSLLKDILSESGKNFVKVIGENNRFEVIPEIFEEFVRLREKHEKRLECDLISARAFSVVFLMSFFVRLDIFLVSMLPVLRNLSCISSWEFKII